MKNAEWIGEFPAAVTVCDRNGKILAMNKKACSTFAEEGGAKLIGTNLFDCHSEPAKSKVKDLLKSEKPNVYTIEKAGVKKLIYQSPWFQNGTYAGFVELSLPIPRELPHFIRDKKSAV